MRYVGRVTWLDFTAQEHVDNVVVEADNIDAACDTADRMVHEAYYKPLIIYTELHSA